MKLEDYRVIPVVVLNNEEDAKEKLQGLSEGNILIAEITFRTAYALQGIKYAKKHFPNIVVGAGTVINTTQCQQALEAGCEFIVSPGLSKEVAFLCQKNNIPYFPGCVTPTEIMEAISLGINVIKFFPANVYGGLKALKALSAPFPQIRFIPTGGVDLSNLEEYLAFDKVAAVGGSFMMKGDIKNNCQEINKILNK